MSSPAKSPAKKATLLGSSSPSPSKKARTDEKPKVKFVVHNQETYKSGLVFLKFKATSLTTFAPGSSS